MKDDDSWKNEIKDVKPLISNRFVDELPKRKRFVKEWRDNTILDLHGMTVNDAFHATKDFISLEHPVVIITGRSGVINQEFPTWMETIGVKKITKLRNGGSYRIKK